MTHHLNAARWLAACAVLAVGGCKCSDVPSGPAGDVLHAYCSYIERCPDQLAYPIAFRSSAECAEILNFVTTCHVDQVESPSGERVPVLSKTPLVVDAAQAAACKAFLDSVSCSTPLTGCDPDTDAGCNPCSLLFATGGSGGGAGGGTGAGVDQRCTSDSDCADGLYCLGSSALDDGGATCAVCKPLRALGGNCGDPPYVQCRAGLFCDVNGSCVALRGTATACTSGSQCASSFCNPTTQLCDPGGNPGDACTATSDCRQGYCDAGGHCADRKPNGAPCAAAGECQVNVCDPGTQKCGKPDGASCSSSYDCQGACDTSASPRVCVPATANGQSCTSSEQCQSRLCHGRNRVCVDPCPSAGDCPAGTYCDSYGACAAAGANGASCDSDEECTSNFCNDDGTCATRPGLGDACSGYSDCLPKGYCSGGTCQAYAKPGEACASLDACAPPFICLSGTCTLMNLACEPGREGAQCAWLQVCDEQSYCDVFNQFTCAAKKAAGGSCLRSIECQAGLTCVQGTCGTFAKVGEECRRRACEAGLYCDGSGSTDVCAAPKPAGASCQDNTDCQSGDCHYVSGTGTVCASPCVPPLPGEQPWCHPSSCADFGFNCGYLDAGCGQVLSCGRCNNPETCAGAGQENVCGCTPSRACLPRECGVSFNDGCGTQVTCGTDCGDAGTCGGGSPRVCSCASDRSAGPSFAVTAISTLSPQMSGGFIAWDSLGNIAPGDDAGVHVRIQPPTNTSQQSEYLVASGFGFNLPPTASVNGIEVRIRRYGTGNLNDVGLDLFVGRENLGRKGSGIPWPTDWINQRFGGPGDLWNYPFTVAQVNSPDFGVGLTASCVGGCDAYVDSVEMTVHYAYRCDCSYTCKSNSECGSDGCGGTCGAGCTGDAGCGQGYCVPSVFVDQATGLMWLNEQFDRANCTGLSAAGYTDWRAPTINELRTRVVGCPSTAPGGSCPVSNTCTSADAGCLDAGCDGCAYRQGPNPNGCYLDNHTQWIACTGGGPFFSTTRDGTVPWVIDFGTGRISPSGGAMTRYRCVRGP